MSIEKKELRVDRIEEGMAIAYSTDGTEYCMCQKIADVQESDILLADINADGNVVSVTVLQSKTEEVKTSMQARLHKLFGK